jgi:hypothetical protein
MEKRIVVFVCCLFGLGSSYFTSAQDIRWLRITELQGPYNNLGGEFEGEFSTGNGDFFSWPAQYGIEQNTLRSRALWIGCKNFDDPVEGKIKSYKVIGIGHRDAPDRPNQIFGYDIKLAGRRQTPTVIVDDQFASAIETYDQLDEVDPNLEADRVITVKFHTSVGISVTKKIMAFDSPYHSQYHINDYVFTNTGIYNQNGDIKQQTLKDVYFYFNFRYSFAGESNNGYGVGWAAWSSTWGRTTVHHNLGDDKTAMDFINPLSPLYHIRAFYCWYSPNSERSTVTYAEDWGCPNQIDDGIMASAKYGGIVTLHADKSTTDHTDDINQPSTTWYVDPDVSQFQTPNAGQYDETMMSARYDMMSEGHPIKQHDEEIGDNYPNNWMQSGRSGAGGTCQNVAYGPYTIAPGDSIHIIFAEGVSGLSREKNREVSSNWIQYRIGTGTPTLVLPDGNTTTDHNHYKRKWVETCKDSIIQTYQRALKNYQVNYQIPKPPPPPSSFAVTSGGDRIMLSWSRDAESIPYFDGYVIYRSEGNVLSPKTVYQKIFECTRANSVGNFDDLTAVRGLNYYYYIQTKDDGSQNDIEPGKPLYSSLFWTITNSPAKLKTIDVGTFRSHQTGNWNDVNSWDWFNGTVWISPAPYTPCDTNSMITIRNGHTIRVTSTDSVDQLMIGIGSTLTIDTNITFIIKNGFDTDLGINIGTLKNYGSLIIQDSTKIYVYSGMVDNYGFITAAKFTTIDMYSSNLVNYGHISTETSTIIMDGSEYLHRRNGGTIPKAIWGNSSRCEISDITNSIPSNINQNFYGLTWNCPNQNANLNFNWQNDVSVSILEIKNTNWNQESTNKPSFRLSLFGADGSCNIGNLYVEKNAALITQDSSFNDTVSITNINILSGGIFILADSGGSSTFYCQGNIIVSDSGYFGTSSSFSQSTILFSRTGETKYYVPSTNLINASNLNYHIKSGTILMTGSSVFTGVGYFAVDSGATLEISQPGGIDSTIKVTGLKTLMNGSNYIFSGTEPQVTGVLLPDTIGSITIIDTAGVMLSHNVCVKELVELQRGTLSSGGNALSYSVNGSLRFSDISPQITTDTEFPLINGPKNLEIANPKGVTLHESRTISGDLSLSGKLIIGDYSLTTNTTSRPDYQIPSSAYVVTNGIGMLKQKTEISSKIYPIGTSKAYAAVYITNRGTVDTVGVSVMNDSSEAIGGGRVMVKWRISENTPGDGNYTFRFTWMTSLESSLFKTNRSVYARIFRLSDTTELGTIGLIRQLSTEPFSISNIKGGNTVLDSFAVGAFRKITTVEEPEGIPTEFCMKQNYPNPFNPSTTISFDLPEKSFVTLKIFDLLGREVAALASEIFSAGRYSRQWNASNIATGIYFYRLQAGSFTQTKKLILLR